MKAQMMLAGAEIFQMTLASGAKPVDASQVFLIGCKAEEQSVFQPDPSPAAMGFKAYNLLRMSKLGLNVPAAFVLGTRYCVEYQRTEGGKPDIDLRSLWQPALRQLEGTSARIFGNCQRPLLLSVRSGAPVSMPGMMDTLLNVGLSDQTLPGLIAVNGNPRMAWDAYRRLVATFGQVVAGLPANLFDEELQRVVGTQDERDLDFAQLREVTRRFLALYQSATGSPFPQDPYAQLQQAIDAVFLSWRSPRAREYRKLNHIDDNVGTAVTVQTMVFGNAGGLSGAGVGFTRDPVSGDKALWVDFLFNAQGEDVVSGRRRAHGHDALASTLPSVWDDLAAAADKMEHAFGDMQEFEFTVQEGRLYMLQARTGKRSARAAARIALDLLDENIITRVEAGKRTANLDEETLTLKRMIAKDGQELTVIGAAASASDGIASGEIALDEARARARQAAGARVILLRRDAETEDIGALQYAIGLLTERGARTSHAAVVARQAGKVCLVGCQAMHIDESTRRIVMDGVTLVEGDTITLDGNRGLVYLSVGKIVLDKPIELLTRLAALRS